LKSDLGIETLSQDEASRLAGENLGYYTADLYNAIARGDYLTWTMYLQVMTPEQVENYVGTFSI
jgi:catalase